MDNKATNTLKKTALPKRSKGFLPGKWLLFVLALILIPLIIYSVSMLIAPKKKETVNLVFWGLWEPASVYAPVISEFEKQHPGITVQYEKQDIKSLGQYINRLSARMTSDNIPDVFTFHNSWVPELRGVLVPLPADVVSSTQLDTAYYPVVKKDLQVNGAYYGIPLGIDTLSLFVNDDLFKKAGIASYPTDWDTLLADAKQLTLQDQNGKIITSGVALGYYDNVDHASDIMSLLLVQNGANLKNLTDSATLKNAQDAFQFYTWFSGGLGNHIWDDTLEHSKLAFAKGKVAMIFGYSWDILDIKAVNPNLKFTVVPVPHLPGRDMTIASYWVQGVSSRSKHPQEALAFLQFLVQKSNLETLYQNEAKLRGFGEAYPRTDMAPLLANDPYLGPVVSQANSAVSTIFSSNTYDGGMSDALEGYLGNAVRSVQGGVGSVGTALNTLESGVYSVMQKYEPPTTITPKK